MIKTACKTPEPIKENTGDYAVQLRLLRNSFLKQYVRRGKQLSSQNLTAFLLYFAMRVLEQQKGLNRLAGHSELVNKTIIEWDASNLAFVGNLLFDRVQKKLPINLKQNMTMPDALSWSEAKTFFEKKSNNLLFSDTANLGFAYQIFSLGMRTQQALPAVQKSDKKISREELIAFTQLYTPSWVVDFLVANTIMPLVGKTEVPQRHRQWLMPNQIYEANEVELSELSLLDPACGAGQFLFSAFDLLIDLMERKGNTKNEAAKIVLSRNIFGADIDEKALWVTGLGLTVKSLLIDDFISDDLFNLFWIKTEHLNGSAEESNFLGSIDKRLSADHMLKQSYKVIVTNPPYLGRKLLSRQLKASLKEQYPKSSNDLAAAFTERCVDMLCPGGKFGAITQASLLAIPSYQALREYLTNNYLWQAAVRCGPGVFPLSSGEKIDSVLLLLSAPFFKRKATEKLTTCFIDLTADKEKDKKLVEIIDAITNGKNADPRVVITEQTNMQETGILLSGLSSSFLNELARFPKLGGMAEIRQGLATTDNARFVRYYFDVDQNDIGSVWIPYVKGAGSERYASNNPFVVKWAENGKEIKEAVTTAYPYLKGKTAWVVKNEEYYFRPGLCFSFINKDGLAVRRLPAGAIFDVASSAIFVAPEEEDFLLAYLNSTLVGILAKSINQSINLQVGDLKKIPVCPFTQDVKNELAIMGRNCFEMKQKLLDLQEINLGSKRPKLLTSQYFDQLFIRYQNNAKDLINELTVTEKKIATTVKSGIKQLGILSLEEEVVFDNWEKMRGPETAKWQPVDEKTFAGKILVDLVYALLLKKDREYVLSISLSDNNSLAQIFNISAGAQNWLEERLGKFLEELFCRSKIFDINELAHCPSRYFSLWSEEDQSILFFSACAVRNLSKKQERLLKWGAVFDSLKQLNDWTSKDILKVFSDDSLV